MRGFAICVFMILVSVIFAGQADARHDVSPCGPTAVVNPCAPVTPTFKAVVSVPVVAVAPQGPVAHVAKAPVKVAAKVLRIFHRHAQAGACACR